jgi:hypothetical protein
MNKKVLGWEIGGFLFIGIVGALLHFTFELTNFENMVVAYFSAVNESTWEHLKMAYFPGLVFMLVEYTYIKDEGINNYFVAKTSTLFVMPLIIALGWYAYTPFTNRSIFPLDLALFYLAVLIGQVISYKLLTAPPLKDVYRKAAIGVFVVLLLSFSLFTFFPPEVFLFEHFDLKDTNEFGILDDYSDLRYFTTPPPTSFRDLDTGQIKIALTNSFSSGLF